MPFIQSHKGFLCLCVYECLCLILFVCSFLCGHACIFVCICPCVPAYNKGIKGEVKFLGILSRKVFVCYRRLACILVLLFLKTGQTLLTMILFYQDFSFIFQRDHDFSRKLVSIVSYLHDSKSSVILG